MANLIQFLWTASNRLTVLLPLKVQLRSLVHRCPPGLLLPLLLRLLLIRSSGHLLRTVWSIFHHFPRVHLLEGSQNLRSVLLPEMFCFVLALLSAINLFVAGGGGRAAVRSPI